MIMYLLETGGAGIGAPERPYEAGEAAVQENTLNHCSL